MGWLLSEKHLERVVRHVVEQELRLLAEAAFGARVANRYGLASLKADQDRERAEWEGVVR